MAVHTELRSVALSSWLMAASMLVPVAAEAGPRRVAAPLPSGPSPVAFSVEAMPDGARIRWTLRNVSDAAVEIASDRRFVWFEVPAPSVDLSIPRWRRRRVAPVRCVFETRPRSVDGAARTELAPGGRYSEVVDLLDVCRLRIPTAMAPGTTVIAHYGFEALPATGRGRPTLARWMARTLLRDRRTYPVNDLSAPLTLVAPSPERAAPAAAPTDPSPRLRLRGTPAQAAQGPGLRSSLSLENLSPRPLWTLFRTVQFSLELETPTGSRVMCNALLREPAPFRELFSRMAAGARRTLRISPAEYCPVTAFQESGLYRVRAVYRTTANGEPWYRDGVFTGTVRSEPFVFRISRGDGRYRPIGLDVSG